jgi:enediyne biosynthesis protein E4
MNLERILVLLFILFLFRGCSRNQKHNPLFIKVEANYTGINFVNEVNYTEEYNVYTYRSFYNGGGVGIGDFNNDNLTGNMVGNKLYINKGNFKFQDVTDFAKVSCGNSWSTGVSTVDINADGYLDIYVCKSGKPGGENRNNQLFVNNGDLTFTEMSKEYGLAIEGLSTHAAFFDYDHDGDLDCYLLTNSFRSIGGFDLRKDQRLIPDRDGGGNKLLENRNRKFVDVSEEAGIYRSKIGFGLGVTIGDLNGDGWEDIYVSNDFFERDYLYYNNQNGTFKEGLESSMKEISLGSMGADLADINNDGKPELFVSEMLPRGNQRYKTKASFDTWDKQVSNVSNGYHKQFSRNTLQYNLGGGRFSEISRFAGVEATDWSWGALMTDLNNDGNKDVFVANGIYKDLLDQDYVNFMADPTTIRKILKKENAVIKQMIDQMPSEPLSNFAFSNNGNLTFSDSTKSWGLDESSFSSGAAYVDLDNDGDMDLVTNNVNHSCFVYKNQADKRINSNFLKIVIKGNLANSISIGTSVLLFADSKKFAQEINPFRGFQSSVDSRLNFGIGKIKKVDSIQIYWGDNVLSTLYNIKSNQTLYIEEEKCKKVIQPKPNESDVTFTDIELEKKSSFIHQEDDFSDFNNDRLLFKMISSEGPKLSIADVTGDGQVDIFVGGAIAQPGTILFQTDQGLKQSKQSSLEKDWISEDVGVSFFDADQDGDNDLYVCSGGNEYPSNSSALADRLYFNDGKGGFERSISSLPFTKFSNSSCVVPIDFDHDGDFDLFVGTRSLPFQYGLKASSFLLRNNGKGMFEDVANEAAPELIEIGMVTDAQLGDFNGDRVPDLVIVGEYMPITVLLNLNGKLVMDRKINDRFKFTSGWWNKVIAADLDGDGDIDIVAGNQGLNNRFSADETHPVTLWTGDFDNNGKIEHILCSFENDKSYPLVLRNDLVSQIPSLKKKYLRFNDYKDQTIMDVFSSKQLSTATMLSASELRSMIFLNNGNAIFEGQPLPMEAQFAPVYAIEIGDFNHDGFQDLLLGGNLSSVKPELGSNEASCGLFLQGKGNGIFKSIPYLESGMKIEGEIRDIKKFGNNKIIIAKNNGPIHILKY